MSVEPTHLVRPSLIERPRVCRWHTSTVLVSLGMIWLGAFGLYGLLTEIP